MGCDRVRPHRAMKKSSHKGYCANRARANPAKGAKKTPVFEEGTGLCTPCVTKRDSGRTSQKCYCGSARSYKQRQPAQEKRAKPKQGPSPPMPSVASTHARPTPSALDRMHRCEPALGRSFPAECALAPRRSERRRGEGGAAAIDPQGLRRCEGRLLSRLRPSIMMTRPASRSSATTATAWGTSLASVHPPRNSARSTTRLSLQGNH